jgi:hypothetical protein
MVHAAPEEVLSSEESEEEYHSFSGRLADVTSPTSSSGPWRQAIVDDDWRVSDLELNTVTPQVQVQYRNLVLDFLQFCSTSGLDLETASLVDDALVKRLTQLHQAGYDPAVGHKLISGWTCYFPRFGRNGPWQLMRSYRVLKG